MNVSGTSRMAALPAACWQALRDPDVVGRALPGCESFAPVDTDTYAFTVTTGVASTRGTYRGTVEVLELHEPDRCRLRIHAAAAPGTVRAEVVVAFAADGDGTRVSYDVDGVATGTLSAVGRGVLSGSVSRVIDGLLMAVDQTVAADQGRSVTATTEAAGATDAVRSTDAAAAGRGRTWAVSAAAGTLAGLAAVAGAVLRRRSRREGS